VGALPSAERSSDPMDDFLLGLCEACQADYLVTGDKGGLFPRELRYTKFSKKALFRL
jgi:predicted nucleic acid-binding protein